MKNYFYFLLSLPILFSCNNMGSCDQFNIDSYEMITGLDIPKTECVECYENHQFRTSVFALDVAHLEDASKYGDLEGYADYFDFETNRQAIIMNDVSVGRDMFAINTQGRVYFKEGENKHYFWRAALVPITEELLVEIERK